MQSFAAATDRLFKNPSIGAAATYFAGGVGAGVAVRVVLRQPDETRRFGGTQLTSDTLTLDVRVAEVPDPRSGDRFRIGEVDRVIQGSPERDSLQLVWTVDTAPAA